MGSDCNVFALQQAFYNQYYRYPSQHARILAKKIIAGLTVTLCPKLVAQVSFSKTQSSSKIIPPMFVHLT